MSAKERREELRKALINAAERRIISDGLSSLRARDIAKDVGCAVGTIYTIFKDLEALMLEVNSRSFKDLGAHVTAAVLAEQDAPPERKLVVMGLAYAEFAAQNPKRWSAVFDIEMSQSTAVPDWYLDQVRALFAIISGPLSEIRNDLSKEDISLMTRGLFASVHGIVGLSVENRISSVAEHEVPRVIELVVGSAVRPNPTSA